MELKRWSLRFLPVVTFFLGLLVGGLPGGLTRGGNLGAVALYLLIVGAVWAVIALLLRRQSGASTPTSPGQ